MPTCAEQRRSPRRSRGGSAQCRRVILLPPVFGYHDNAAAIGHWQGLIRTSMVIDITPVRPTKRNCWCDRRSCMSLSSRRGQCAWSFGPSVWPRVKAKIGRASLVYKLQCLVRLSRSSASGYEKIEIGLPEILQKTYLKNISYISKMILSLQLIKATRIKSE
ncbi:hypothetical protein Acry_1819 [Acidiphilium cryptum JF-5]|uniref:Uncharacterized protein n=1 Tax=Acidiphilium cryptum (strain JF-5) TaxID=349163 RepID=A5FZI9_ACICJ|nr:hypothetical protein Acry_1819 [Acidiphilium cryptum JF-5]